MTFDSSADFIAAFTRYGNTIVPCGALIRALTRCLGARLVDFRLNALFLARMHR